MKKRIADIIIEVLEANGIKQAFCVPGGGAMYLNNALALSNIKTIFNHHEQACAISCEGYAKYSSKPALCCVTSGPGGTNTLTGIMGAYQDYTPIFVLSGQVRYNTTVEECGLNIRRRGEQEFDIVNSVKNMTKYAKMITDPLSVKQEIQKAFDIMMNGARGPVWIDVPLDIQSKEVEENDMLPILPPIETKKCKGYDIDFLINEIKNAKRPLFLAGSAVRSSGERENFLKVLEKYKIPTVSACCFADNLYNEHSLYFGTTGTCASRAGNLILQNADLIVILGSSLGFKQTTFSQETFASKAKIIMININSDEALKPGLNIFKNICCDLKDLFKKLLKSNKIISAPETWIKYCNKVKRNFGNFDEIKHNDENDLISAQEFWEIYSKFASDNSITVLGNSSCIAGYLIASVNKKNQRSIVNVNCGSMGCDIPLAIGASCASGYDTTLITGDGSFMMNSQELATIMHNKIPVKIILFSNKGYNAIRNTCKNYFKGKFFGCSEKSGLSFPNFKIIANAYNIEYLCCKKTKDIEYSIKWINSIHKPCILEIKQVIEDSYIPSLKSRLNTNGTFEKIALHDMYPFLDKKILEKYMINKEVKC